MAELAACVERAGPPGDAFPGQRHGGGDGGRGRGRGCGRGRHGHRGRGRRAAAEHGLQPQLAGVGLHLQRIAARALPLHAQRVGALQRPFHGAVGPRAVGGLQFQPAEFQAAGVDVGLAGVAQLQHALGVEGGAPGALFGPAGQGEGQALGGAVGLQLERAEKDVLRPGGVGRIAGGHLARDAQARRVQAELQAQRGGLGGAGRRRRVAQHAQATLPVGVEPGAAFGLQARLAVHRGADRRAHDGQGLQAAHPGQHAAGVVQVEVQVAAALSVRGLALPAGLRTGQLQRELAVEAACQGIERALAVQRGVGHAQAGLAQVEHALRGAVGAGAPAAFHIEFAQPQAGQGAAPGLRARRLDARAQVDGGVDRARRDGAVQRGRRDAAPELGRVDAAGLDLTLPLAQRRGLRAAGGFPLALALHTAAAELRVQLRQRPACAALFERGLDPVERQALPVGRPAGGVGELQLGAPGLALGLGLHRAAEQRHRRLRPEGGEVDAGHGGVGGLDRLRPPWAQAGLGIQRGGLGRVDASGGLDAGAGIERGVGGGQHAGELGDGLQRHGLATRHGGAHLTAGVHAQGHRGLRAQHRLGLVAAAGHLHAVQVELVRVGHAEVPGAVGRAVAVLAFQAAEGERRFASQHQFTDRPGQGDRQGQGNGLQRLGWGRWRGRALVVDLQAADVELRQAHAAPEHGVGPEPVAQADARVAGLHAQAVARPLQLRDLAASQQAALHTGHFQRAGLRPLPGHERLTPANGLGQRAGRGGPQADAEQDQQHQRRQAAEHPAHHAADARGRGGDAVGIVVAVHAPIRT